MTSTPQRVHMCATPLTGLSRRLPRCCTFVKRPGCNLTDRPVWPNRGKGPTVPTLQTWINQNSTNIDVVTPIKERACDALAVVLRSRPHRSETDSRVMRRGVERC